MSLGRAAVRAVAAGTVVGFAAGLRSLVGAQAFALRHRALVLDPRLSSAHVLGEQAAAASSTASAPKASVVRQGDVSGRPFFPLAQDVVSLDNDDPRRLRILHLSDIHLLAWQRRELAWIERLVGEDPDLLVLTGDSIAYSAAIVPLLCTLSAFVELPGLFIFGSNGYYSPRPRNPFTYFKMSSSHPHGGKMRELLWSGMRVGPKSFGWIDLDNQRTAFTVNRIDVDVIGVDDPHVGFDKFPVVRTRLPGSKPRVTIGLAHALYARAFGAMADDGRSLVLTGYTRGGQVYAPGEGALATDCNLPTTLVASLHRWLDAGQVICHDGATITMRPDVWVNVPMGLGALPFAPVRLTYRLETIVLDIVFP